MTTLELTGPAVMRMVSPMGRTRGRAMLKWSPVLGALALGGCITIKAPEKPIVIELNINIKQEVVYRLAADAGKTITTNPEIF